MGRSAYPDKVIMRVHASLRDDFRLWSWAAGGALLLFTVIVLLGVAPLRFPSVNIGHRHETPVIVLQPSGDVGPVGKHGHAGRAVPQAAATAGRAARPTTGTGRLLAQPKSGPATHRPAPSPIKPTHIPDPNPDPHPGPTPESSAPGALAVPQAPLPSAPDPVPWVLPPLPAITVPPVEPPTSGVPTLQLP